MNKNQQTVDEKDLKNKQKKSSNSHEDSLADIENKIKQEIQPELPSEPGDPMEKMEEELALASDKYLRLVAEFENYKKRNLKERLDLLRSAGADVIISILPVLDDFERAAQAGPLPEGVMLIFNKLVTILGQHGLKSMEAKGKDFDPELHDALTNIPVEDEQLKNKVLEEIEKGYFLNEKVIRHAKVVVGN